MRGGQQNGAEGRGSLLLPSAMCISPKSHLSGQGAEFSFWPQFLTFWLKYLIRCSRFSLGNDSLPLALPLQFPGARFSPLHDKYRWKSELMCFSSAPLPLDSVILSLQLCVFQEKELLSQGLVSHAQRIYIFSWDNLQEVFSRTITAPLYWRLVSQK